MAIEQSLVEINFNKDNESDDDDLLLNAPTPAINHQDFDDQIDQFLLNSSLSSSSSTTTIIPETLTDWNGNVTFDESLLPQQSSSSSSLFLFDDNLDLTNLSNMDSTIYQQHQIEFVDQSRNNEQQQQIYGSMMKTEQEIPATTTTMANVEFYNGVSGGGHNDNYQEQTLVTSIYPNIVNDENFSFERNVQFVENIAHQLQQNDDINGGGGGGAINDGQFNVDDDILSQYSLSSTILSNNQQQQNDQQSIISSNNGKRSKKSGKDNNRMVCMNANAIAARQNRAKKKNEMQALIDRNQELEQKNSQLKNLYDKMADLLDMTRKRQEYLESIVKQTPQILELIQHMKKLPTIKLNSVNLQSFDPPQSTTTSSSSSSSSTIIDETNGYLAKKRLKSSSTTTTKIDVNNNSIVTNNGNIHGHYHYHQHNYHNKDNHHTNAGICFHLKPNREMSLEFCHNCSAGSNNYNNGGGGGTTGVVGGGKTMMMKKS